MYAVKLCTVAGVEVVFVAPVVSTYGFTRVCVCMHACVVREGKEKSVSCVWIWFHMGVVRMYLAV